MWVSFIILEYVKCIMWATRTNYEYSFIVHTFKLNFKFGLSYTPGTVHLNYHSSQE